MIPFKIINHPTCKIQTPKPSLLFQKEQTCYKQTRHK
jgi:hypothetical protein